ncbi:DUF4421 family protein [Mangrovibacterium lignilyticum]|uniref:DUF4421 family protein n=1 Tax=Mangrovibacterium lignilyticum TaxID=2668052 RepID=UPI0013D6F897|nr:DUF4421 family protein [Mangrovibacterium lignilyticum]
MFRFKPNGLCGTLLLASLLLFKLSMAQESKTKHLPFDRLSPFIQPKNDRMSIKVDVNNHIDGFNVSANEDLKYKIRPNDRLVTTFSLNYHFIAFNFSYIPRFIGSNSDDELKGKTKYFKLGTHMYLNRFYQEIGYARTKGYYLYNPRDFDSAWMKGDPYPQFPELVTTNLYGRTSYQLNPNFSVRAFLDQTEKQLRTAGSFITMLSYSYYRNDNKIELTENSSSQKSGNFELLLNAGYFHTLVLLRNFSLTTGVGVGVGGIQTKLVTRYFDESFTNHSLMAIYRGELLGVLGYDSRNFFAGTRLQLSGETYNQAKDSGGVIVQNHVAYSFYIGFRFNVPKPVKKANDKLEHFMD